MLSVMPNRRSRISLITVCVQCVHGCIASMLIPYAGGVWNIHLLRAMYECIVDMCVHVNSDISTVRRVAQ